MMKKQYHLFYKLKPISVENQFVNDENLKQEVTQSV